MDIDIYCGDSKCPVCGNELDSRKHSFEIPDIITCSNGCYLIDRFDGWEDSFYVFEKRFIVHDRKCKDEEEIQKVVNEIKYWKENDRYLMKIIEG